MNSDVDLETEYIAKKPTNRAFQRYVCRTEMLSSYRIWMGTLRRTCATAPRRGPLPKLLGADWLLSTLFAVWQALINEHNDETTTMLRASQHFDPSYPRRDAADTTSYLLSSLSCTASYSLLTPPTQTRQVSFESSASAWWTSHKTSQLVLLIMSLPAVTYKVLQLKKIKMTAYAPFPISL